MAPDAFVTGGTGFIGRRLVRRLLDDGWTVRAFVLQSERARLPKHTGLKPIVGDITQPESLRGTMDDADAVFHIAALVDSWVRDPHEYVRVNVEGTAYVVDEALRATVPRVVFTSSMSGIGVTPGSVMREDSPPGRVFGEYEASKAEAERLVAKAVREKGLPGIILIPSIVIGPGDTRNTGRFLLSYVKGEFPGTFAESSVLPVVDVDDVVQAHIAAYERGRIGERYIISGENMTWGDLLRLSSDASGTPVPSRHIGERTIWLASRSGELLARVRRTPPRLPAWLADFLLAGASMDHTKSVEELGMSYRPIAASINDTVAWFRQEGLFEGGIPAAGTAAAVQLPVENPPAGAEASFEPHSTESVSEKALRDRRPKPPEGGSS